MVMNPVVLDADDVQSMRGTRATRAKCYGAEVHLSYPNVAAR